METNAQQQKDDLDDLIVAVEDIAAVRSRADQPSDGGSTGRGDLNDGIR